jgi:hypothetical protein
MGHESRDVEGAHADQAHVIARGREGQRAVRLVVESVFGHDPGTRHYWQRFVKDTALWNGEGEAFVHWMRK